MFTAPHITHANLADPRSMLEPNGDRSPTFDDASLQRAVTEGLDPDGEQLSPAMPRWHLTQSEWASLLTYLRTLR